MDSLDQATKRYHEGLREFVKGDAGPALQVFSQREDVVLCNPFHPFARGPREVAEAAEQAASHFADGVCEFETVAAFATAELGYTIEIERFRATLDGSEGFRCAACYHDLSLGRRRLADCTSARRPDNDPSGDRIGPAEVSHCAGRRPPRSN